MKEQFKEPAGAIRRLFGLFTALCAIATIVCMIDSGTGLQELLDNLAQLCTQPAQLTKSFFDASYGGLCRNLFERISDLPDLQPAVYAARAQSPTA